MTSSPTLCWPGKQPPAPRVLRPAHLTEIFRPAAARPATPANALFWGDNLDVLGHLLAHGYRGRVKLIYLDPPFDTGLAHRRKVRLRQPKAPTMQTAADAVVGDQLQYDDRWPEGAYLQFLYERLPALRELLAEDGTLWLHCDHRQAHHLRVLLQEIFGAEHYLNTVIWRSQVPRGAKVHAFYFPFSAHYLTIFAKDRRAGLIWHPPKKRLVLDEAEAVRSYLRDAGGFFRTSDPGTYSFARLRALHAQGRLYAPYGGEIVVDEAARRIYASRGGNIAVKYYLTPQGGGKWAVERAVDNVWDDIPGLGVTPGEDLGYPTQKTEALLERILTTATNAGDLVLDSFMGSGTTLAVAQRLGRQWIGCDNNRGALVTTRRRLQALMLSQPAPAEGFAIYQLAGQSTDPAHLQADVQIVRNPANGATIEIAVSGVISPGLATLLASARRPTVPEPVDWRALVDCIAIDPAYNGDYFTSVLVDAPLKKSAQVAGVYTIAGSPTPTTVAVRITDLLGDEVTVTRTV
jgi:DNA modification methylase